MSDVQKVEVDDEVVTAVADQVKASLILPTIDEIVDGVAAKMVESTEKTIKKEIHEDSDKTVKRNLKDDFSAMPHEISMVKAMIASKNHDYSTVARFNSESQKRWAEKLQKANYQNEGTGADGGDLVPYPEFMADVERLTNEYGTAARLATVRSTSGKQVTVNTGTNEVTFTKVAEATAANASKLTYGQATVTLDKYIATLVMTSELVEDSAVDVYADAAGEIARARAKLFDDLVFTDATYGLVTPSAGETYKTVSIGSALSNINWDSFSDAIYSVLTQARKNGRFFMHPTVWNKLIQVKASTAGTYLVGDPMQQLANPSIGGYPVEFVEELPDAGTIGANKAFAVFGDLSRVMVHVKRQLETKIFDAGVVKDSGGSDFNLITQDSYAMRATLRCVPQTRFQKAFCILGTGTVS